MKGQSEEFNRILNSIPPLEVELTERIAAEAKLEKLKVPKPTIPEMEEDEPLIYPRDLSGIADQMLGKTYGQYMAWTGYCRYLLNLKEADILLVKNTQAILKKQLKAEAAELQYLKTVEARKDYVELNGAVIQLDKLLTEFEVEKQVVEARFYHFDNCSKALSREISRRDAERDRTRL